MLIQKKPSRRQLLQALTEIQNLIGAAMGKHGNDRNPNGFEEGQKALEKAHELCIQARAFDPPTDC